MKLEVASVVKGSETPAGDGVSGALRCIIRLPDGTKRSAILKRIPIEHIAAEVFSAIILQEWGLPVPCPFLIDEGAMLAFASADIGYPNLKQSLAVDSLPVGAIREAVLKEAVRVACGLSTAPLAVACDEAIDNRDRNLGNILWDGTNEIWIDHALSLGQGAHLPDRNKMCDMSVFSGQAESMQYSAMAQALLLSRDAPTLTTSVLASTPVPTDGIAQFVASRLTSLGNRLVARFPRPVDLLTGHDQP
ncbi:hypothetical protein [Herbaspirillum sp. SJZ107]|uniref:hypothetical protein n=1 Tax=Herbaspirillum sp. SJZ107 TaxID=2572881 RepID=UPI00114DFA33|nr:hypothetical protein [Herbaspirillum sp. SJZ107]TQK07737.1 hypothetical protein FBX97_3023 [Herbaspirillum sp. SJZ107]